MWAHLVFRQRLKLLKQKPQMTLRVLGALVKDQSLSTIMGEPLRGHNMQNAHVPFVASIAHKKPDHTRTRLHTCTGCLIAHSLVLTAAHCLEGYQYNDLDLVIGVADLRDVTSKYNVRSWMTFKQWAGAKNDSRALRLDSGDIEGDIALIRLARPVFDVTPANITTLIIADLYGKNGTIIGWTVDRGNVPRYLKKAQVQVLTATDCNERYQSLTNRIAETPEGQICTAANPYTLTTNGDSGGPLLDEVNNILGIARGTCPTIAYNCTRNFADRRRFNLHTVFIQEYRQFIDEIKSSSS